MCRTSVNLGREVERAYSDAIAWWLGENTAPGDLETRLSADIRRVTIEVQLHPGRMGSVFVSVQPRRAKSPVVWPHPLGLTLYSALKHIILR